MVAGALASLSTSVIVVDELFAVREIVAQLEAGTSHGRPFPGLLDSPEITVDRLRAFAEAAAAFYSAQIWDHLANENLIVVEGARS